MTGFTHIAVVDWSAASSPSPARPAADAIWIGVHGPDGAGQTYHRTRASAEAALRDLLARPGRWLIGFDFPMGYPAGFAARLTGVPAARAVWRWLAQHLSDGADNRNTRFETAAGINMALGGLGPFWGRPRSMALPASVMVSKKALSRKMSRVVAETALPCPPCYPRPHPISMSLPGLTLPT